MIPTQPGRYSFHDGIGGPAQLLEVREAQGELVAVFPAADGEPEAGVPVGDMQGEWEAR
jgi:hypothetical protein